MLITRLVIRLNNPRQNPYYSSRSKKPVPSFIRSNVVFTESSQVPTFPTMENFIDMEFFEEKSSTTKRLYFLYSLLGGLYYEPYVYAKFRYLLLFSWCAAHFTYITSILVNFTQHRQIDVENIDFYVGFLIFVHTNVLLALIVFLKRASFHRLFDTIDKNLKLPSCPRSNYNKDQVENNVKKVCSMTNKFYVFWLIIMYSSKLIQKLVTAMTTDEFCIDYHKDFFMPIPSDFFNSQTFMNYIFFYHLTFLAALPYVAILYGSLALPTTICVYLKSETGILKNDIEHHCDLTFECLEECYRREERILETEAEDCFQLRDIATQRSRHIDEFMIKVHQWIRIHQYWMLCANLFKKCVQATIAIQLISSSLDLFNTGYFTLKLLLGTEGVGYEYITYSSLHIIILLILCALGDTLNETSDILSVAVYEMPWYYLPINHRKVVLNFMTLIQKRNEMTICDVYPLSLELFPNILNNIYGYIQILRVLEIKHKHD